MNADDKPYPIEFTKEAAREVKELPTTDAKMILQEIQSRLSSKPFKGSKTRIKRLVGFAPPLYRLRAGDYRAYYRILTQQVVVLTVLHKKDSARWLKRRT